MTTTLNYETGTACANATPRIRQIVQNLAGTTADLTTSFTWNPSGQIATRVRSNDSYVYGGDVTLTRTYAVNGLNQYTQVGPNAPVHDANGNLTSDGTGLTLIYDAENRLVSASGTRTANLVWDPLGRLFETSANGVGITRFLYDGDELALEYDSGNTVLRRYVHSSGADDPLIWYEGAGLGTRRHLYGDIQGSIIAVTDATGTLSGAANAYDDWGVPGAANQGRFQYTGQAYIPELGMYHYKARIYSPTLGRFLQTDPIGYDDQVNLYAYVGNDPVMGRDPSGLAGLPGDGCGGEKGQVSSSCAGLQGAAGPQNKEERQQLATFRRMAKDHGMNLSKLRSEAGRISHKQFADNVKSGGKWDFKIQREFRFESAVNRDRFGNYMFGVLARANGFSLATSVYGAGAFQTFVQGHGNGRRGNLTGVAEFATSAVANAFLLPHRGDGCLDCSVRQMIRDGFSFGDNHGDSRPIMLGYDE